MNFLSGFFASIAKWIIENLVQGLINYFAKQKKEAEQRAIDEKNVKDLIDSVKQGKSDEEISQNAEDLLNGIKRD